MAKKEHARHVRYEDLDAMLAEADAMLANGYDKTGNWSLGQAAGHVAQWASFPMDGFPEPPAFMKAIFWVLRKTGASEKMATKIKAEGFKPGMATAPTTVPSPDSADADGVAQLRQVVEQLKSHDGPLHDSPLFGQLDKPTHISVTLLHAAHHFGFLVPHSKAE
ncbi:MAG TPA: hypothetical protein DDW52_06200 [Planctomycetaceae bacterium]|nr:hypothetical protein [Planctomycetaceae bacterium]